MSVTWARSSPVRVLVVDDSAFMRNALTRMINSEPEFEVVDTASNGSEALSKIAALNPDLITLDLQMPELDGIETLRRIMQQFPRPVIVVSATGDRDCEAALTVLSLGAFDYVPKELASTTLEIAHIRESLVSRLRAAANSVNSEPPTRSSVPSSLTSDRRPRTADLPAEIVAIGASTGGPGALQQILLMLPEELSVPILIVQHMPDGFIAPLAHRLNSLCSIRIREAEHLESIEPGVVYIAPAGAHMSVQRLSQSKTCIWLDSEPSNFMHVPSIDVMMESVAEAYGDRAMGVILTGMGHDGAEGMKAIHARGGTTIGQDQSTSLVYSMPGRCAELGLLERTVAVSEIAKVIVEATRPRTHAQAAP